MDRATQDALYEVAYLFEKQATDHGYLEGCARSGQYPGDDVNLPRVDDKLDHDTLVHVHAILSKTFKDMATDIKETVANA